MADLIGVAEAARRLGVNKSTVSRYVARYAELNRAAPGAAPRVEFGELARHRQENMNPDVMGAAPVQMAAAFGGAGAVAGGQGGNEAGGERRSRDAGGRDDETPAGGSGGGDRGGGSRGEPNALTRAKTVSATVQAQKAQIDLQAALGSVVPRDEVAGAAREAGAMFQQRLALRRDALAEAFASMTDEREIALRLEESDRDLLAWLAGELQRVAREDEEAGSVAA